MQRELLFLGRGMTADGTGEHERERERGTPALAIEPDKKIYLGTYPPTR